MTTAVPASHPDPDERLRLVVQALAVVYGASSSNAGRRSAESFLEQIRDSDQAVPIGYRLAAARSGYPLTARHFGLGLIESTVKYKWELALQSPTAVADIQRLVLDLCISGLRQAPEEEPAVIEKLAKVFVELAKRTWPAQWTDMDAHLRVLYDKNPLGRYLVLLIYKSLAEDVFLFEDAVAMARKKELSTALFSVTVSTAILEEMLSKPIDPDQQNSSNRTDLALLLSLVRANLENEGWLMRWSVAIENLVSDPSPMALKLIIGTLECIAAFLDWTPLKSITETGIHPRLLGLVETAPLPVRIAAANCLTVLYNRNIPPTDQERMPCIWQPVFVEGRLAQYTSAWNAVYRRRSEFDISRAQLLIALPEDEYVFLKHLVQAIVMLGINQICFKRNKEVPIIFNDYIQLVLVLSAHPSLIISGFAITFFVEVLKHEQMKVNALNPYLLSIAECIFSKLLERKSLSDPSSLGSFYARIDFDSSSEIETSAAAATQRAIETLRLVVPLHPSNMLLWLQDKCFALFSLSDPKLADCYAVAACVDAVLGALPVHAVRGTAPEQVSLANEMMRLLTLLIEYDGQHNSVIIAYQLQMIVAFSEFMDLYPNILFKCLEKFFAFTVYTTVSERGFLQSGQSISDETRILRRKAASSLVRIGLAMPGLLEPLLPQILPAVQNLIQTNQLVRTEQTLLTEFLITIINGSSLPVASKRESLETVLHSDLERFQAVGSYSQSMNVFLDASGILTLSREETVLKISKAIPKVLARQLSEAVSRRSAWSGALNAIWMYLRRLHTSKSPSHESATQAQGPTLAAENARGRAAWPELGPHILPHVLAILKCLHATIAPSMLQLLSDEFRIMTKLTPGERSALLGKNSSDKDDDETGGDAGVGTHNTNNNNTDTQTHFHRHLNFVCGWLGRMREICYQILNVLTTTGVSFYGIPSLSTHLTNTLFVEAQSFAPQHWKSVIVGVMRPLVLNCPSSMMAPVLLPVLSTFFNVILASLTEFWKTRIDTSSGISTNTETDLDANDDDDDDEDAISDEIVSDKLLRHFTRIYADLWTSILVLFPDKGTRKKSRVGDGGDGRAHHQHVSVESDPKPHFLHQDLVAFIFSHESLIQSFMSTISLLLNIKDTSACKKGLAMCSALVVPFCKNDAFHQIVGRHFLMAALEVLHDGYQKENHNDAIGLITESYVHLRGVSMLPFETMMAVPGMNAELLQKFEVELADKTTAKERHLVVRSLLKSVTGLEISEQFKKNASFVLNLSEKRLFEAPALNHHRDDIVERETVAPVLSAFFGDEE